MAENTEKSKINISVDGVQDGLLSVGRHELIVHVIRGLDQKQKVAGVGVRMEIDSGEEAYIMRHDSLLGMLPTREYAQVTDENGAAVFVLELKKSGVMVGIRFSAMEPDTQEISGMDFTFTTIGEFFPEAAKLRPSDPDLLPPRFTDFPEVEQVGRPDLVCTVESPDECDLAKFACIRAQITEKDTKSAARGIDVELRTASDKVAVFRQLEAADKVELSYCTTDFNGFAEFLVRHDGDQAEDVEFNILWNDGQTDRDNSTIIKFKETVQTRDKTKMMFPRKESEAMTVDKDKKDSEKDDKAKTTEKAGVKPTDDKGKDKGKKAKSRALWAATAVAIAVAIVVLGVVGIDVSKRTFKVSTPLDRAKSLAQAEMSAAKADANTDMDVEPGDMPAPGITISEQEVEAAAKESDPAFEPASGDENPDQGHMESDPDDPGAAFSVSFASEDGTVEIVNKSMWDDLKATDELKGQVESLRSVNQDLEQSLETVTMENGEMKKELGKPKYVIPKKLDCRQSPYKIKPGGVIELTDCKVYEPKKPKKKKKAK